MNFVFRTYKDRLYVNRPTAAFSLDQLLCYYDDDGDNNNNNNDNNKDLG